MKKSLAAMAAVACCAVSSAAMAYPSVRASVPGSAIFIYVSNPEDRSFSCTISYAWSHDSYGDEVRQSENFQVSVPAKAQEFQAQKISGSYVNVRVTAGPTIQCNPN